MDEYEYPEDTLVTILTKSGFKIVPIQAVVDALAQMEEYICEQLQLEHEELDPYLEQIEALIGRDETFRLELDEIVGWVRAFRGY